MGWFKKEAKALGKEVGRQGCILLFGTAPKSKPREKKKTSNVEKQYHQVQRWAKRNGFK